MAERAIFGRRHRWINWISGSEDQVDQWISGSLWIMVTFGAWGAYTFTFCMYYSNIKKRGGGVK